MPDDLKKTGKEDDVRINKRQAFEVRDWATKLGVTRTRLLKAIQAVGPMVADVTQWLIDNPQPGRKKEKKAK